MWKARIHPDDFPQVLERWEAAKNNHRDLRIEFRVCLPSGAVRWIEGKARFFYTSGKPYRVIGASRDITERKLTEQQLRSGRDRLLEEVKWQQVALQQSAQEVATHAELLDLTNDAAFISDLENKITYWNRGAERLRLATRRSHRNECFAVASNEIPGSLSAGHRCSGQLWRLGRRTAANHALWTPHGGCEPVDLPS
jgi:PAS domain-containing protein